MARTTYKEIQRRVQQRIQNDVTSTSDTINDFIPKMKVWINERYERIIEAKPWHSLVRTDTLTIVASQKEYALPRDFGQVVSFFDKTNGLPMKEISLQEHIRNHASALDQVGNIQTGDPTRYYRIGEFTSKAKISSAETIALVSTSSSDASPLVVHIKGKVSGAEVQEDVILTGTSTATSSNTYDADQRLEISIGTNDGTTPELTGVVTVSGSTSSTVYSVISEFDLAQPYWWIEVSPTPKATGTQPTWDLWYKKRFYPLKDDNDIPEIDCVKEIIQGVYSDALREDGQPNEANVEDQKFIGMVEELWASQQNPNQVEQFIPQDRDVQLSDDFGRTVFLD